MMRNIPKPLKLRSIGICEIFKYCLDFSIIMIIAIVIIIMFLYSQ